MPELAIEVIPVIDLKGGAVVRARHGSRHSYVPIVTPLARTSASPSARTATKACIIEAGCATLR